MILTKSPISRHVSAGPIPWSALVLRFFAVAAPFCPPPGPATRSFNGLHPERKFQATTRALAVSIICHLSAWQAAAGIAIAGYREFPSGLIGISLTEGGVTQSMEMTWGQASAESGMQKSNDGKISFGGTWYPRIGDSLKASPEAKAIPDIHKQLQSMLRNYRLVMPSSKGNQNPDRSHERFEMSVMVGDHPGEARLTYFESDSSQWSNAQAMWKIARDLFPAGDREKISKQREFLPK